LVLVEEVVDLELSLRQGNLLATELILELDQFVFELYPALAFVVEVKLQFFFGFSKLVPFVFEHELHLAEAAVLVVVVCLGWEVLRKEPLFRLRETLLRPSALGL
jgi:hypothetical protein